jgi:long-chain acyl-CoA synthetase
MLVQQFLERSADRTPDKCALVVGEVRWTYQELDDAANRLANAMLAEGLERGGRVAIYLPNCADAVVAIFATLKAGGVFVVINRGVKEDKLVQILRNCEAAGIITDLEGTPDGEFGRIVCDVPTLRFAGLTEHVDPWSSRLQVWGLAHAMARHSSIRPAVRCIDLDLACLIYTSGSTGEPKGVMSDHSNVVFVSGSIIEYLQNTADDIVLCGLPLSFDYGLYQLLMTFRFGGTLILEPSFTYPAQLLQRIQHERVTGLPGVPTLFAILQTMDLSEIDLTSLRYITNTAAALPVNHILALRAKFPDVRLYSMYGLTETKRTLFLPPEQLNIRPESVGIPIPGTEAWIEDEDGKRLGPGEVGELVVRGRHVMRGYWRNPVATAKRFPPGAMPGERVCRSGDLFRRDEEGYFYFVSRKDEVFKSRGEKVAPKEVEAVLYELPGVAEAAVVGVPDEIAGHAVKAILALAPGSTLTKGDVLQHCRRKLEPFMVPKIIEFRSSLPKSSSGKIVKTELVTCVE